MRRSSTPCSHSRSGWRRSERSGGPVHRPGSRAAPRWPSLAKRREEDRRVRPTPILLTDPDERSTLATARALVAAGYPVTVAGPRRWSLAGVSRGVRMVRIRHDPLAGGAAYVNELARVIRQQGIGMLVPTTDGAMEAILEHAERLPSDLILPIPAAP